jgi:hypothetical protein
VKIVGKKNVATLKAGSKVVFAPPSSKAMPKAAAQKTVVPKSVPPVALSTVSGAGVMKVVTAGRYGAQGTMKARVLKIKARQRKATSTEPSLVPVAKKAKVVQASSSAPTPAHKVVAVVPPAGGSDDDRVEACSMLCVVYTSSSSSSSSSEMSASENVPASPLPIPDLIISSAMVVTGSELPMIPEVLECHTPKFRILECD